MTFAYAPMQWRTADEFRGHLAKHDPAVAPWARGIVVHHTYRPLPTQWLGLRSIAGLKEFYLGKEWDSGPHLFICVGARNPADDGIFQLTPLNVKGIHATYANSSHWGIEVVGDYDGMAWPPALQAMVYDTMTALLSWRSIDPASTIPLTIRGATKVEHYTLPAVMGHREVPYCVKTCPGKAINMDVIRKDIRGRMWGKP